MSISLTVAQRLSGLLTSIRLRRIKSQVSQMTRNEFAPENLRYILDLLLSVITASMRTVELVAQLPEMEVVE